MTNTQSLLLEFGSRSGSWFALFVFAVIFAALGLGISREIRRRSGATSSWIARCAGAAFFVGPLVFIYVSSLGGFYEVRIDGRLVRLHYLVGSTEIPVADISDVRTSPWYRGRWRMQIAAANRRYESATWHRQSVEDSTARFKNAVGL